MNIKNNATELIGNTPMLMLESIMHANGSRARIAAKLESFNPAGSAKDRAASYMLSDAEARGLIKPGATIIEPTSGNTGIGLSFVGALGGYRVILTMPDTMSSERVSLLKAHGAEIVLTDGRLGMSGAIEKAKELAAQTENSFIPDQFSNKANIRAHYETTGPEIWRDSDGEVDCLVAGVGTGGTISGAGEFLKSKKVGLRVVAIEPFDSPVLSGGKAGSHALQGIGANFVPELCNTEIIDEIIAVSTEQAYSRCKELARLEGLLAGISSGAALHAALELSKREEYTNKLICVIFPDSGEHYLSVKGLFD